MTDFATIKKLLEAGEIDAVSRMGTPAALQLMGFLDETPEHMLLSKASEALVKMGKQAIPVLLREITNKHAQDVLIRIGPSAVPYLIETLKCGDATAQKAAANVMVRIGVAKPHFYAILKIAEAKTKGERSGAIYSLREIAEKNSIPDWNVLVLRLLQVLEESNNRRWGAGSLFMKMGLSSSLPVLLEALMNEDAVLRRDAVRTLGKIVKKTEEIDLSAVQKALKEFVDSVKEEGNVQKTRKAEKEALGFYPELCAAVRERIAKKHSLAGDGVILVGELPRPPRDKTYRAACKRRAFA